MADIRHSKEEKERQERIRRRREREEKLGPIITLWLWLKAIAVVSFLLWFLFMLAKNIWEHGLPTTTPDSYWR